MHKGILLELAVDEVAGGGRHPIKSEDDEGEVEGPAEEDWEGEGLEGVFFLACEPFGGDDEEAWEDGGCDASVGEVVWCAEVGEACEPGGEGGEVSGAEDEPTEHDGEHGEGPRKKCRGFGGGFLWEEEARQKTTGVEESPKDKGPGCAMPETADEEDDEDVADVFYFSDAATAERDVEVALEPAHEGHVPAAPEVGDVGGEVGEGEVAWEADAKEFAEAEGHVGVAGEVAIDLDGVKRKPRKHNNALWIGNCAQRVADATCATICYGKLLEEAPQELATGVDALVVSKVPRLEELWELFGGAGDGTGHELWEEAHVGEEGEGVAAGWNCAAGDVENVGDGLEGVEGEADGEDEFEEWEVGVEAKGVEEGDG